MSEERRSERECVDVSTMRRSDDNQYSKCATYKWRNATLRESNFGFDRIVISMRGIGKSIVFPSEWVLSTAKIGQTVGTD